MRKRFLFFPILLLIPMVFLLVDWVQVPRSWNNTSPGNLYTDSLEWTNALSAGDVNRPAYRYVQRDSTLPDVLIMGNSISIGYTPYVRGTLAGKANVYRIPENARDSEKGVANIDTWLANARAWEVIHFNWGLHEIKRIVDGQFDSSGERFVSPEDFTANLEIIIKKLLRTEAQLIFATTSIVPEQAQGRIRGDEVLYNKIAREVLKKYPEIMIDDQYTLTAAHPEEQLPNNVHFHAEGYQRQGRHVAERIIHALTAYNK